MATISVTHDEVYKDIRGFLLGLFPEASQQIIKAAQNNNPLPENAIVMQFLFDRNLDVAVTNPLPPDEAVIQNSVEVRFQIDFYGALAASRGRTVENLWRNGYACERLMVCQPLYVQSYNRNVYINDSNQYEDRWILDVALQYNPQVTVAQDYTDQVGAANTNPVFPE